MFILCSSHMIISSYTVWPWMCSQATTGSSYTTLPNNNPWLTDSPVIMEHDDQIMSSWEYYYYNVSTVWKYSWRKNIILNVYEILYSFFIWIFIYIHFVITTDSFVNFEKFYGVKMQKPLWECIFEKWPFFRNHKKP